MAKSKSKWYVVWRGQRPGIYTSWPECQKQIHGFPDAKYKSFKTRAAAESAYKEGSSAHVGVGKSSSGGKGKQLTLPNATKAIIPSLSVDAACSGNPGLMEYRGVDTETGEVYFHEGPFEWATNNIGEFLALVDGLRMLAEKGSEIPIYSDSRTAMAWVRNAFAKTTLERNISNEIVFQKMEQATQWLKDNPKRANTILKWETDVWGEIPADFGRK
ncbi:MAG TPA: ribonuclease H [Myxococcales bacterium]|nr:ribonuclease H [Deltaproteobacteria bacterium]HAA59009.1 ribonuclease H [Myxococcales bacterium]|tara:strand:+ start:19788 stop:20435 length:648 start_codon:yes stop_codon:yes gene_type:complete